MGMWNGNVGIQMWEWEFGNGNVEMGMWECECGNGNMGMWELVFWNENVRMGMLTRECGHWNMVMGMWEWIRYDLERNRNVLRIYYLELEKMRLESEWNWT